MFPLRTIHNKDEIPTIHLTLAVCTLPVLQKVSSDSYSLRVLFLFACYKAAVLLYVLYVQCSWWQRRIDRKKTAGWWCLPLGRHMVLVREKPGILLLCSCSVQCVCHCIPVGDLDHGGCFDRSAVNPYWYVVVGGCRRTTRPQQCILVGATTAVTSSRLQQNMLRVAGDYSERARA